MSCRVLVLNPSALTTCVFPQAVHVGEGSTTATQAAAAVAALDADKTLCQAVCSLDLYLIGFTMLIVGGSGMVIINNISQIVAAIPGMCPLSCTGCFVVLCQGSL